MFSPSGIVMDHECSFCCLLLLVLCCAPVDSLQCGEETEAGRQARINALKREILLKLQIPIPPNVTNVHPINHNVFAEYNATVAAQVQVNKALVQCAQHGRSSKELFVLFPISVPEATERREVKLEVIPISPSSYAGQTVTFSVDFRSRPEVSSAELRLYKIKDPNSDSTYPERVIIYHVFTLEDAVNQFPYDVQTYVTSKYVSAEGGYEVFNVTTAILEWINYYNLNGKDLVGTLTLKVLVGSLGANYTPSLTFVFDGSANDTVTQLVIACYETTSSGRRNKRNTTPAINSTECLMSPPQTCCLRNLVVDFHRDLGFNWILQPTTYAINYCAGLCPWTVPQASQSSMFLAYANERNPTASPQPCCAPDIFHPLTVVVQRYDSRNPSNPPTQEVQLIPDLVISGEPVIPGSALPEAFTALEQSIEATLQMCKLKASLDTQVVGMVTVCDELQRLLKLAFIENGMLATRIEILARYHGDTVQKLERKIALTETENRVTRKQLKRLRKRQLAHETLQMQKNKKWWAVNVKTSDYDSLSLLSRTTGVLDLEFMLRLNQLMIDFVTDDSRTELFLPPMGYEERAEVSKLASIYKLRCRFGKTVQVTSSTLFKARQTCIPAPGEVDNILNTFTKQHKNGTEEENNPASPTEDPAKYTEGGQELILNPGENTSPATKLPSSMLTPIANAGFHVDLGIGPSPSDSPVLTPTDPRPKPSPSASKSPMCMPPLPPLLPPLSLPPPPPPPLHLPPALSLPPPPPPLPPTLERFVDCGVLPLGSLPRPEETGFACASPPSSESCGSSLFTTRMRWSPMSQKGHSYGTLPPIVAPSNPMTMYTSVQKTTSSGGFVPSSVLLHRQSFHPTVVASPLKMGTPAGGGGDRERELLAPPLTAKRLRLTRNSRGNSVDHEDTHLRGND
ncbi:hypothetical protein EMCRGX_G032639 [Ephydatia muelleri]